MIDLVGLNVVVTGSSRGIGAACCRTLARAGATVLVHYRSDEGAARAVLAELDAISNRPHRIFSAELADERGVRELFDFVGSEWGRLDCLVNNAGIWVRNPIAELDPGRADETWSINLRGPFLCARHAIPLLHGSANASIINLSSTAAQRGEAFYSPYAASKGALIAATKSWAVELAPDIRVNAVAPGWTDTDMCAEPFAGAGRRQIEATIPLGRVATPEDIAGPVLFLASPLARHITGEILNVNGGAVLAG